MEINRICKLIDERRDELFELLCGLIRVNSENFSSHGNEENMARHLYAICNDLGLETDMFSPLELENFEQHPDYLPGRNLENRYNVVARWRGAEDLDKLMLMAHEDTVQIGDEKNWNFPPLAGIIKDGKVWGRGACDDKYAIATALFVIKLLKEQGFSPKANLLFAAYSDEEHGGSHGALSAVLKYPCEHIVNMDGREEQLWHCGVGGQELRYTYHTKEAVDSASFTAKAIPVIMEAIDEFGARRRNELEENPYYIGTMIPKTALRYMDIHAGNNSLDLGIGTVTFEFYADKPKEEIDRELAVLTDTLAKRLSTMGIIGEGFIPTTRFFHYVECAPDSEDICLMLEAAREATGKEPLVCGACQSDLSVISKYGSSRAFGFGVGREFSKAGGAHQANEFIECDRLVDYAKTIAAYIIKMLSFHV